MRLAQAEGESAQAVLAKVTEDLNRALTVVLGLEDVIARGNPPAALVTKHNDILAGTTRLIAQVCDEVTSGGGRFIAKLPGSLFKNASQVGLGTSMALNRAAAKGCVVTISEREWRDLPRREVKLQATVDSGQQLSGARFGIIPLAVVVIVVMVSILLTTIIVTLSPKSRASAYELRTTADNAAVIFGGLRDGKITADDAKNLLKQEQERHEAAAPEDSIFDKIKTYLLIGGGLVVAAVAGPPVIEAVQKIMAKKRAAA